jgi:muramoyltetrapeptide carboxypeptidase LdcA involved in peptidoglycan recycling
LVQPAGFVADLAGPQIAIETIRGMGLVPKLGQHVYDRHGYLAGTDESRAADINAMFADTSVRAIFAARGGWGSARVLPYLNWNAISANPKLLVGFSDITALHMAIAARGGFPTIHASNAGNNWGQTHARHVPPPRLRWRLCLFNPGRFGGDMSATAAGAGSIETVRPGKATGRLIGGNLTVCRPSWARLPAQLRWRHPVSRRRGRGRLQRRPDADPAGARRRAEARRGRGVRAVRTVRVGCVRRFHFVRRTDAPPAAIGGSGILRRHDRPHRQPA